MSHLARSGEFAAAMSDLQADFGPDWYRYACPHKTSKPANFGCRCDDVCFGIDDVNFGNSPEGIAGYTTTLRHTVSSRRDRPSSNTLCLMDLPYASLVFGSLWPVVNSLCEW